MQDIRLTGNILMHLVNKTKETDNTLEQHTNGERLYLGSKNHQHNRIRYQVFGSIFTVTPPPEEPVALSPGGALRLGVFAPEPQGISAGPSSSEEDI